MVLRCSIVNIYIYVQYIYMYVYIIMKKHFNRTFSKLIMPKYIYEVQTRGDFFASCIYTIKINRDTWYVMYITILIIILRALSQLLKLQTARTFMYVLYMIMSYNLIIYRQILKKLPHYKTHRRTYKTSHPFTRKALKCF